MSVNGFVCVAQDYGDVIFTRTWTDTKGVTWGKIEYDNAASMDRCIDELNGRRIQGCHDRLIVRISLVNWREWARALGVPSILLSGGYAPGGTKKLGSTW